MATLLLDTEGSIESRPAVRSLQDWLSGAWGLLFSHPDDFAPNDVEADRWLVLLEQSFAVARVRPFALASDQNACGWLAHVNGEPINGEQARVVLAEANYLPHIFDFRVHALREAIARSDSRFVIMLDDGLRLRRTFKYSLQDRLPSLFDLVAMIGQIRTRTSRPGLASAMGDAQVDELADESSSASQTRSARIHRLTRCISRPPRPPEPKRACACATLREETGPLVVQASRTKA